jgi:putative membrane protein
MGNSGTEGIITSTIMNTYEGYYFWGMHTIWWVIWVIILFWIFAVPYNIPGQRAKKESPLDVLKQKFASGAIDQKQYLQKKKVLED